MYIRRVFEAIITNASLMAGYLKAEMDQTNQTMIKLDFTKGD